MKLKRLAFTAAIILSILMVCPIMSKAQNRLLNLVDSNEIVPAQVKKPGSLDPRIFLSLDPVKMYDGLASAGFGWIRCEDGWDEENMMDWGTTCYFHRDIDGKEIDLVLIEDNIDKLEFSDLDEMNAFVSDLIACGFTTEDQKVYCCERFYMCFSIEDNVLHFWGF